MEEFEFSQRAERLGAVCVSDPGAYVFHIPHETVFGSRAAFRNIGVFDRTFDADHIAHERRFIVEHVVPWYWSGGRKAPRVGLDACPLDAFGAPPGFEPPLHLRLMRSLSPLIDPARRLVKNRSHEAVHDLRRLLDGLDEKLLARTSPANIYQQDLRWILRQFQDTAEIVRRVEHWLEGAEPVDREMIQRPVGNRASA